MAPAPRLDALTGLRFLAAAAVAFAHMPHLQSATDLGDTVKLLAAEGGVGVPFFFILSGFVLAYSYHARLADPTRGALAGYFIARIGRIWPVHLLALGLTALMTEFDMPVGSGKGLGPAIANVFLVHAWLPVPSVYLTSYNPVSWSLSIEWFFYLTLPALLWSAARYPVRPLILTLCTILVWLPVFLLLRWHVRHPSEWTLYVCGMCPLVRLGEFVSGVWLGLAFVRSGGVAGPAASWRGRVIWTVAELAAVAVFGTLLFEAIQPDRVAKVLRFHAYYTPALAAIVGIFARQRGQLSNLLAKRVPVLLGEISFSFFMLHCAVFVLINSLLGPEIGGTLGHTMLLLFAAGVVSAVVYRLYEIPLRGWVVRRGSNRKVRPELQMLTPDPALEPSPIR